MRRWCKFRKRTRVVKDAMVIAQNKIETSASVGEYSQEMHDNIYDVKISNVNRNEYCIRIYVKEKKVLDYKYYQEENH